MCPAVKSQRLPHFLIPLDDAVYNISPELAERFVMSQVRPEGTESRSKTATRAGKKREIYSVQLSECYKLNVFLLFHDIPVYTSYSKRAHRTGPL